jgi:hypothetical protein
MLAIHAQFAQRNSIQVDSTQTKVRFDPRQLTFGGGFGLQFGNYTLINVAPQIGYNFSKLLNAGGGFSYTYFRDDFYVGTEKWKERRSYLGFNIYARVYPVSFLVFKVQPEIYRMWETLESKSGREKYSNTKVIPTTLVGGGVRLGPVVAMLEYDIIQNRYSPYGKKLFYSLGYSWSF